GTRPLLRLSYSFTRSGSAPEPLDYDIDLATTRPRFGGLRWWFLCPGCDGRVGKLYLPPGERLFSCRKCHDLTYTSCQQHDRRVDALRRNPEQLAALAANLKNASLAQLGLLLKAIDPRKCQT